MVFVKDDKISLVYLKNDEVGVANNEFDGLKTMQYYNLQ